MTFDRNPSISDIDLKALFWAEVGGAIMVAGGALALEAAFNSTLALTFLGYMVLAGGFRLSQLGANHALSEVQLLTFKGHRLRLETRRVGLLSAGAFLTAHGTVLAAEALGSGDGSEALLSGAFMTVGYAVAHYGLNNEVL